MGASKNMKQIIFLSSLPAALALLALLTGIIRSCIYTERSLTRSVVTTELNKDVYLEVDAPRYLFLNDAPGELRVNVWHEQRSSFGQDFLITIAFPPGLHVAPSPSTSRKLITTASSRLVVLSFDKNQGPAQQALLEISNAGTLTRIVETELTIAHPGTGDPLTLSTRVELPGEAARRVFWTGAVGEKGPIIFVGTLLAPVFALLFQYYQQRQEVVRQERKTHIMRLQNELREALIAGNEHGVRRRWEMLRALRKNTEDFTPRQDWDMLKGLVYLAQGALVADGQLDSQLLDLIQKLQRDKSEEVAGALVCSKAILTSTELKLNAQEKQTLKDLFRNFPSWRIRNSHLLDEFIQLRETIVEFALMQSSQFLSPAADKALDTCWEKAPISFELPHNPFAALYAENEGSTLYNLHGFWCEHPIVGELESNDSSHWIVSGLPGCGRTALAKWLYFGELPGKRAAGFRIYCRLNASRSEQVWDDLQQTVAHELLSYLEHRAVNLSKLRAHDRDLLAAVLCVAKGRSYLLAALSRIQSDQAWLKNADENQRPIWETVGVDQLHLLKESVKAISPEFTLGMARWLEHFCLCVQRLGLNQVYLYIDCATHTETAVYQILQKLPAWDRFNLWTTLFVPEAAFAALGARHPDVTLPNYRQLTWEESQLKNLLLYRLKELNKIEGGHYPNELAHIEQEVLDNMFVEIPAGDKTPRYLAWLWQAIVCEQSEASNAGIITKAMWRSAQKRITG